MMNLRPLGRLLVWVVLFGACGNGEAPPATPPAPTPVPTVSSKPALPSVPFDTLKMLYERSNYIDYLFYDLPVSMSQNNQQDVRGALAHISSDVPVRPAACQPIGQVFYEVDGTTRLRANLYFSPGCMYLEFLENDQPAYANKLMPDGVAFFNNLLQRLGKPTVE